MSTSNPDRDGEDVSGKGYSLSGLLNSLWSAPEPLMLRAREDARRCRTMFDNWQESRAQRAQTREANEVHDGSPVAAKDSEAKDEGDTCPYLEELASKVQLRDIEQNPERQNRDGMARRDENMHKYWMQEVLGRIGRAESEAKGVYEEWNRLNQRMERSIPVGEEQVSLVAEEKQGREGTQSDSARPASASPKSSDPDSTAEPDQIHVVENRASSCPRIPMTPSLAIEELFNTANRDIGHMISNMADQRRSLTESFLMGLPFNLQQDSAMAYLVFSQYSPLHLEHQRGFDATFRQRFEDLLKVQSGQSLPDRVKGEGEVESLGKPKTKLEWISGIMPLLKGRGDEYGSENSIMTGNRPNRYPEQSLVAETQTNGRDQAHSEDANCTKIGPSSSTTSTTCSAPSKSIQQSPSHAIQSSITTTKVIYGPDGSSTTKIFSRTRFADGTERNSSREIASASSRSSQTALHDISDTHGERERERSWARMRRNLDLVNQRDKLRGENDAASMHRGPEVEPDALEEGDKKGKKGWFWAS